ncbi:MAG: hypothetical protein MUC49_14955 [Raineya sp.]|jgi:hypothetical protein|nr:hypothetical protein [Raineya sp.]
MEAPRIDFKYNWNKKLDCLSFTTFRIHNPSKYQKGKVYELYLKGEFLGLASILDIKKVKLSDVNEWIAQLDSGYNLQEFKNVVKRMYGSDAENENTLFDFILLKKLPPDKV